MLAMSTSRPRLVLCVCREASAAALERSRGCQSLLLLAHGASLGLDLPLAIPLRLLHCCEGVDLGDLTLLLASAVGLADISAKLCTGNVDTSLVSGALVGLTRQGLEVVAVGSIAEFLDVGVVDLQAELVELALDVAEDLTLCWRVLVSACFVLDSRLVFTH